MVSCTDYDRTTNVGTFYSDTVSEIAGLPDLIHAATAPEIIGMHKINAGSTVLLPNGTVYILKGVDAENGGTWDVLG